MAFAASAFRDGKQRGVAIKSGQPLTRYFPELIAALAALKATTFVLDGEIVVPDGTAFSFDALLQRIHPAKSRVTRLATETPALFIVFDILVDADRSSLVKDILDTRRKALERFAKSFLRNNKTIRLSPATVKLPRRRHGSRASAMRLTASSPSGATSPTHPAHATRCRRSRTIAALTVSSAASATTKARMVVGSLLLGLYDDAGLLHHVSFTSGLKAAEKADLTVKLEKLIAPPGFTGDKPGGPSRWSTKRSTQWQPLKPKLVVEVRYDHFSGDRFRHGTTLLRWRPDKSPRQCTFDQLKQKKANLQKLLK